MHRKKIGLIIGFCLAFILFVPQSQAWWDNSYGFRYEIRTNVTSLPNIHAINDNRTFGNSYTVWTNNATGSTGEKRYVYCTVSDCATGLIAVANETDQVPWELENTTGYNTDDLWGNPDMLGEYHLDTLNDSSPYDFDCDFVGAHTPTSAMFGNGMTFDTNTDTSNCGVDDMADTTHYTISFWAYPTNNADAQYVYKNENEGIVCGIDGGGKWYCGHYDGDWDAFGSTAVVINQWIFVAMTWDGSDLNVYLNAGAPQTIAAGNHIGWSTNRYRFKALQGIYDEVRIYNGTARTHEQIRQEYYNGLGNISSLGAEETPPVVSGPQYSNEASRYASPTVYDDSKDHSFQIQWDADSGYFNTSNVTFQANFTGSDINYTYATSFFVTNDTANIFYINISQSEFEKAAVFRYRWIATNTTENTTSYYYYTISKNSTTLHIGINGTEADTDYDYGNVTNTTANMTISGGTLLFERNGTDVGTEDVIKLSAAVWNYSASLDHDNYTAAVVTRYLTINTISASISFTSSPSWSVAENTQVTITTTASISSTLYRDGVVVASPYTITLSFGTYNFTMLLSDTHNYTSGVTTKWLTVSSGGFGCTDTDTYAFSKNITGNGMLTLNFTDILNDNLVKANLSDVWVNTSDMTGWFNQTGTEYYLVVNATNHSTFTLKFGNYIGNVSWTNTTNDTYLMHNFTDISGYSEINSYYMITFLEEATGAQQFPPDANRTLSVFCTNGVSSFDLDDSKILVATFEQATELKAMVSYSATEIYYRNLIVRGNVEYKNYYLVDANINQVAQMQIDISDMSNTFGAGDVLKIKKQLEGTLQTITEGYLDAEVKIILYLINADRYQVYIDNGDEERNIGYLYIDPTDLTKTIVITTGLTGVDTAASNVSYSLNMTDGTIYFHYIDGAELTQNVSFWVYNYSGDTIIRPHLYLASSLNHSRISFSYIVANPNGTYYVEVDITREGYTNINIANFFVASLSGITQRSPIISDIPSSYFLAASLGLILMIPMLFGGIFGAAAGVIMVLMAGLLAYWGLFEIGIVFLIIAGVFAVFNALTKRKVVA